VLDFLEIIDYLSARKVSVFILQNGLETLLPDGHQNPIAQLVLGMLAQFNNLERTLIRARMSSGYDHYRAHGGRVGRKEGYRKSLEQYKQQYSKDISLIRKGVSYRNINAITGTSLSTLTYLNQQFVKEGKKM
jgi:DNA invertase Pin-like site-specific DNA recombinase